MYYKNIFLNESNTFKIVRNFFVSNKYLFFLSLPLDYFIGLQHEKVEQKLSYLCFCCVILIIYSWLPTNEFIIYPSLLVRYTLARLLKSAKWFCVILIPWNGQYEHKHIQDNCVFNLRKDKIIRIKLKSVNTLRAVECWTIIIHEALNR